MSLIVQVATGFALGCYALASVLVVARPAQDRVFALDLLYVHAMLVVMVVGIRYQSDRYFEAALLIALFGFVSSAAMAKFILRGEVIE